MLVALQYPPNSLEMGRIHRYYAGYYADIGANYLAVEAAEKAMKIARRWSKPSDDATKGIN